jgi:hypothetical protein
MFKLKNMQKVPNLNDSIYTNPPPFSNAANLGQFEPQLPRPASASLQPSVLLIDMFNISKSISMGTDLYKISSEKLLKDRVPWDYYRLFSSKRHKMDPTITFHPVKLSDAPVKLKYQILYKTSPQAADYTEHSDEGVVTVTDSTPFSIKLGLPWRGLLNATQTTNGPGDKYLWPVAQLRITLDQPYMPTSIHPDNFNVLVTVNTNDWETQGLILTPNSTNAIFNP